MVMTAEAISRYTVGSDDHGWYARSEKSGRLMHFGYNEEAMKLAQATVDKWNKASETYEKHKAS